LACGCIICRRASLRFISAGDLEPIHRIDQFQPYYLTKDEQRGEPVRKLNLFTQNELTLYKANYDKKPPKEARAWESEINPALSYIYDKRLRFGVLHRLEGNHWMPQVSLDAEQSSRFDRLFGEIKANDPVKYGLVKEAYTYASQPVPRITPAKLGIPDDGGSEEDYHNAFLLSRIANLPLSDTYRNHSVSDWIRSMLYTYYRAHNILISNSEELRLGDNRKNVTGALTIAPESGVYYNMAYTIAWLCLTSSHFTPVVSMSSTSRTKRYDALTRNVNGTQSQA
jgi:hypothetical protein